MRRTVALALAVPLSMVLLSAATDSAPERAMTTPAATAAGDAVAPAAPADPRPPQPADAADGAATAEPVVAADGTPDLTASGPSEEGAPADGAGGAPAPERVTPAFLVAAPPSAGGIAGEGPRWRYSIELEPGLDVDLATFAAEVRAALHDPRSWARERTMEHVGEPSRARIRIVLASPDTVDELCGRVGLRTQGIYSCWNGEFAALNAWRWEVGAEGFADLTTYRTYLVNHEVGHGLGFGHVGCPAEGALAPVMMQQSKGLGGCRANGWPAP